MAFLVKNFLLLMEVSFPILLLLNTTRIPSHYFSAAKASDSYSYYCCVHTRKVSYWEGEESSPFTYLRRYSLGPKPLFKNEHFLFLYVHVCMPAHTYTYIHMHTHVHIFHKWWHYTQCSELCFLHLTYLQDISILV